MNNFYISSKTMKHWHIGAPFIHHPDDFFLHSFVPNEDYDLSFTLVPAHYRHDRSRKITGARAWLDYFQHASRIFRSANADKNKSGIITCFPQLAVAVAIHKKISFSSIPLIAWNFNLGQTYPGAKQKISQLSLSAVDTFVVHSRHEIKEYSEWLQLPPNRFEFVPLQRAVSGIDTREEIEHPFLLSMGTANRDYKLLLSVLQQLGYPSIIVAGPYALRGLKIPANVEVRSGLSQAECNTLVQRARLSVIPVDNQTTASGQVTLLDAMMFGRATVITKCPASVDYVEHNKNAIMVSHGNRDELKDAIELLWQDASTRERIGNAARNTVIENYSDEAIGSTMGKLLRKFG